MRRLAYAIFASVVICVCVAIPQVLLEDVVGSKTATNLLLRFNHSERRDVKDSISSWISELDFEEDGHQSAARANERPQRKRAKIGQRPRGKNLTKRLLRNSPERQRQTVRSSPVQQPLKTISRSAKKALLRREHAYRSSVEARTSAGVLPCTGSRPCDGREIGRASFQVAVGSLGEVKKQGRQERIMRSAKRARLKMVNPMHRHGLIGTGLMRDSLEQSPSQPATNERIPLRPAHVSIGSSGDVQEFSSVEPAGALVEAVAREMSMVDGAQIPIATPLPLATTLVPQQAVPGTILPTQAPAPPPPPPPPPPPSPPPNSSTATSIIAISSMILALAAAVIYWYGMNLRRRRDSERSELRPRASSASVRRSVRPSSAANFSSNATEPANFYSPRPGSPSIGDPLAVGSQFNALDTLGTQTSQKNKQPDSRLEVARRPRVQSDLTSGRDRSKSDLHPRFCNTAEVSDVPPEEQSAEHKETYRDRKRHSRSPRPRNDASEVEQSPPLQVLQDALVGVNVAETPDVQSYRSRFKSNRQSAINGVEPESVSAATAVSAAPSSDRKYRSRFKTNRNAEQADEGDTQPETTRGDTQPEKTAAFNENELSC